MDKKSQHLVRTITARLSEDQFQHMKSKDNPSDYIRNLLNEDIKKTKEG